MKTKDWKAIAEKQAEMIKHLQVGSYSATKDGEVIAWQTI